jgi:chromosome segregation protein
MTVPARLLALRLQGFKSFAERTEVEFGPGISAVVGPNGSGKSNLADALRWALGEQGRALRTRKSEDVIFAGSERRAALGMADVALIVDNADGLLPIEFGQIEFGRRLYRSGENDYLLNRQRVRLRDLVDLLDAGNLADNAFLFIGQGTVDQALSLRPEERRPLFEEVAGVRRHERRRRRAEEQLAESETNLARVEDVVAELRPQVRRLAAQAEQQATRLTAGEDLAAGLIVAAHARWHQAATRAAGSRASRDRARSDADAAMARLTTAEEAVAAIARELGARASDEMDRAGSHELARSRLTELQLLDARLAAELEAVRRDRDRASAERVAAEADLVARRRVVAVPVPPRDHEAEAGLVEAERALADGLAELAALRTADAEDRDRIAAYRRATAARQTEVETARRRLVDAERRTAEERRDGETVLARRAEAEASLVAARAELATATSAEAAAATAREEAQAAAAVREAERLAAADRLAAASASIAGVRARAETLEARLAEDRARPIARAAQRRGGRRIDEGLAVDPAFAAAVEAVLGEASRAYLVGRDAVPALATERGTLVVEERLASETATLQSSDRRVADRATILGGGPLENAIRRDPSGAVRRILERTVWLPDVAAALEMQGDLRPGWLAVVRDGSAVVGPMSVSLGRPDGTLDRQAEAERLATDLGRLTADLDALEASAASATGAAAAAADALRQARESEAHASADRRRADDADRLAAQAFEALAREATWHEVAVGRLDADVERLRAELATLEAAAAEGGARGGGSPDHGGPIEATAAIAAWQARIDELRSRRDRLAAVVSDVDGARREAEAERSRAEASVAMSEERIARADRDLEALAETETTLRADREQLAERLEVAASTEASAREALATVRSADAADRQRLAAAETEATAARERLRAADERSRQAEVADLEARLGLDAIRESILVELAAIGDAGAHGLARAAGMELEATPTEGAAGTDMARPPDGTAADAHAGEAIADDSDAAAEVALLEGLLDRAAVAWEAAPPEAPVPSPGRLASLRRRYHELGASNPFAADEHATLRARLDSLETQSADLRDAIARTRSLIDELNVLVAEQFTTTFRALEAAFDRQFGLLFSGGFARLSLTDPDDLATSGIEIVARPPGKKAQNLAMLSGGERALTAVALLFAMLEVRPVPFCVLDEVDAALDEANVGRFTESLRELASRTQCIVITHNRGTIEAADALYGVTVGDDSVSRVISLRLEEARAIAGTVSDDDTVRRDDAVAAG